MKDRDTRYIILGNYRNPDHTFFALYLCDSYSGYGNHDGDPFHETSKEAGKMRRLRHFANAQHNVFYKWEPAYNWSANYAYRSYTKAMNKIIGKDTP